MGLFGRAFQPSDLFRSEHIGEAVTSPDERYLAIVRIRPISTVTMHMRDFMNGNDRGEIWLHNLKTSAQQKITKREPDGAGFFAPVWSPNGRYLAMLSTRGDNITLWVWSRSTRHLRQVSPVTVELGRPVWISDVEIVCATPPEGELPGSFDIEVRAATKAMKVWPRSWAGTTPTVSAIASGTEVLGQSVPVGRLLKFNVLKSQLEKLANGTFAGISASPDGRSIAAYEQVEPFRPEAGKTLTNRNYLRYALVRIESGQKRTLVKVTGDQEATQSPIAWLADGSCAAVVQGISGRPDWFLVRRNGERVNLTASLKSPPPTLVAIDSAQTLLAAAEGKLWKLAVDGSAPQLWLDDPEVSVQSILSADARAMVLRAQRGGKPGLFHLDFSTRLLRAIPEPAGKADFRAFLSRAGVALFHGSDRQGTYLWATNTNAPPVQQIVLHVNQFVSSIEQGQWKAMKYAAPSGQDLTAWLLLPSDYQPGKRYKTVVSVYPGLVYTDKAAPRDSLQSTYPYNTQLLAARGYVVLFPSIPLGSETQLNEHYRQTAEGVLPAIDEAVKVGIADPDRLAVMGHSYGGFATYALITETNRFKAAVSLSGIANFTSLYSQFDARTRYDEVARERLVFMVLSEAGQFQMGTHPWADRDRYVRNSPISFADRVKTPLMIVQGDQDYIPIQQGEEFFTALYRLNKPAVFVRYWGEAHILQSPANILDFWERLYQWLEKHLGSAA